jgi:hypothetical protein
VHFLVEILDGNLFVSLPNSSFNDHELLVEALQGCGSQGARVRVDCVRLGFGRRPSEPSAVYRVFDAGKIKGETGTQAD